MKADNAKYCDQSFSSHDEGIMNLRKRLVDAVIDEIRREMGTDSVHQDQTRVEIDGTFRMARALEAGFKTLFHEPPPAMVDVVARELSKDRERWQENRKMAEDILDATFSYILDELDPMR